MLWLLKEQPVLLTAQSSLQSLPGEFYINGFEMKPQICMFDKDPKLSSRKPGKNVSNFNGETSGLKVEKLVGGK